MSDIPFRRRVAVDLSPLEPAGLNGGIKPLTLNVIAGLAERGWEIVCLCNSRAHAELRAYLPPSVSLQPLGAGQAVDALYDDLVRQGRRFDLNFFPMQRVSFTHVDSATVSAIMDVQFADLPENFEPRDRAARADAFQSCVDLSDRIVAISAFTRNRIAALSSFPADLIDVIHIMPPLLQRHPEGPTQAVLAKHGLEAGRFLIFPANFWVHKGHRDLLAAYAAYRDRAGPGIKLVLTGDPSSPLGGEIADLAAELGQGEIVMAGFLPADEIEILLGAARALIFPSSYEGFGIPLIEAMMLDVPVTAAWATCIPEIAGGAALLFDQKNVRAIADAIERIVSDDALRGELVDRGRQRLDQIGSRDVMISRYEQAFEEALAMPRRSAVAPVGIFPDGWMGRVATFRGEAARQSYDLEVTVSVPDAFPREALRLAAGIDGRHGKEATLWRGATYQLHHRFDAAGGELTLVAGATFRPADLFASNDTRELSVRIGSAVIRMGGATLDLLGSGAWRRGLRRAADAVVALSLEQEGGTRVMAAAVPADAAARIALAAQVEGGALVFDVSPGLQGAGAGADGALALDLPGPFPAMMLGASAPEGCLLSLQAHRIGAPAIIAPRPGEGRGAGFSVVIPSYNQGRFIGRTVESVLAQSHICDIHVFDGGSSDETVDVLRGFGNALKFDSRPDGGQADAVNKGIAAGRGDYIAWINSDDTYQPGAFDHVAELFAGKPDVGVIYGEACHIDEYDVVIERYPTEDFDLARLFEKCFLCQPATFFRRELVERLGGLRATLRYCLDYELWLRFGKAGVRFLRTASFLANSRFYADTKTLGARPQAHFETVSMFAQCFGLKSERWIANFAQIAAEHLEKESGSLRDLAFDRSGRLARAFWERSLTGLDSDFDVVDRGLLR